MGDKGHNQLGRPGMAYGTGGTGNGTVWPLSWTHYHPIAGWCIPSCSGLVS